MGHAGCGGSCRGGVGCYVGWCGSYRGVVGCEHFH